MRKYWLASAEARQEIDLRDYAVIIKDAVHTYMPNATVQVEQNYYSVEPTPKQGDAVKIGRKICQSELGKNCILIAKLFYSREIEEDNNVGTKAKKPVGGHH